MPSLPSLCLICNEPLVSCPPGYWVECPRCGFMASSLQPALDVRSNAIDERLREQALQPLRKQNYQHIVQRLGRERAPASGRLLDVGSAHGWFLDVAQEAGWLVTGIEPDSAIAQSAIERGHDVRLGTFPDCLPSDQAFDVITFHDVFEHMPNLAGVLKACHSALRPSGLLAIALPNSRGAIFRTARWLSRLGIRGPLDRMWQVGFPSPHLTYFHPDCLAGYISQHRFREIHRESLPSLVQTGLWQRLRYDRNAGVFTSAVQYVLLSCMLPILRVMPSDGSFQIFEKSDR